MVTSSWCEQIATRGGWRQGGGGGGGGGAGADIGRLSNHTWQYLAKSKFDAANKQTKERGALLRTSAFFFLPTLFSFFLGGIIYI